METLKRFRLYAKALCVYNLESDPVFQTMQKIFQNEDDEDFIPLQRDLCRLLMDAGSLEEYLLGAILTNDNVFARAAAAGKEKELPQSVQRSVVADLKKLSQLCAFSAADIYTAAKDPDVRQILSTMPAWQSLNHAGVAESDTRAMELETDRDDGRTVYEFSWKVGFTEYDYEIDADTGAILSYSQEED